MEQSYSKIQSVREDAASQLTTQRLVLGLLLVRLLNGVIVYLTYDASPIVVFIANLLYLLFTYFLTAILIWRELERLHEYFIGKLALVIFILSKPVILLLWVSGLFPNMTLALRIAPLVLTPVSIWLAWVLWKAGNVKLNVRRHLPAWLLVGALTGTALAFLFSGLAGQPAEAPVKSITPLMAVILLTVNLSSAAVDEEPLFRGFLWGWLIKRGWREGWIWLFQAFLFWAAHLYYLGRMPLSLWVIVPVSGLALGLLAWRARDIAPPMVAHGIIDGLTQILAGLW